MVFFHRQYLHFDFFQLNNLYTLCIKSFLVHHIYSFSNQLFYLSDNADALNHTKDTTTITVQKCRDCNIVQKCPLKDV